MNRIITDNWNKSVKPYDTVYHLGDFGALEFASQLNGSIHLITGNYEGDIISTNLNYLDELKKVFKSVEASDMIVLSDGSELHLSHKPSAADHRVFNAFGHIHGRQMCKKFGVDVGVDAHHFTPISEETLLFYKNAIQTGKYDEEVFL
jgi:calcineurin-like phosphoesterase family protein